MGSVDLPPNRPALMGILNVTPDSFSDGGRYLRFDDAVEAGIRMIEEGADLIDVGGESTRPGAEPVSEDEEIRRTVGVVSTLAERGICVSIDTRKPGVAKASLGAGAVVVNDVGGLADPEMINVCREAGCSVCIMHMKGTPQTMQTSPSYSDVVEEVKSFLIGRASEAEAYGILRENIWIDPGIGFGKTAQHNLQLLNRLEELTALGHPVLIGVSRKSFLGSFGGKEVLEVGDRLSPTLAVQAAAQMKGARVIRAHDVRETRRAIDAVAAIQGAGG